MYNIISLTRYTVDKNFTKYHPTRSYIVRKLVWDVLSFLGLLYYLIINCNYTIMCWLNTLLN